MNYKILTLAAMLSFSQTFAQDILTSTLNGPPCSPGKALPLELNLVGKEKERLSSVEGLEKLARNVTVLLSNKDLSKKEKSALSEMSHLARIAIANFHDQKIVQRAIDNIQELNSSLIYKARRPIPSRIYVHQAPAMYYDLTHNPVGQGSSDRAANNLVGNEVVDSTFWKNPGDIAGKDLYNGFGRSSFPKLDDSICTYLQPKTGTGTNPGFSVKCDGVTYFLKFAEESSQAFATRIFWALGYNTNIIDNAPFLKVRYDRKILTEFNLRKDLTTSVKLLPFLTVGKIHLQKYHDPFHSLKAAVLKDGSRIESKELRQWLFLSSDKKKGELDEKNYNVDHEAQIDYLITASSSLEIKEDRFIDVGPWGWDALSHQDRRELRGLGLLAAWVNWYDARWDNNKVRLIQDGDALQMKHVLVDLGSVLGVAGNTLNKHEADAQKFPWEFTTVQNGKFRITRFQTIEDNEAFKRMNLDDARWMAGLIARLSEEQIKDALSAAGFAKEEVEIYHQKLLHRREKMLQDLGM